MKKMIKFKLIAALIAVMMLLIFANANGQGIKISALPTLTSPDSSADYIPIVHSGTTYKVTPGKLFFEFGGGGGGSTGWALNGNTVGSEKFIGTLDNYAVPVRVNNAEVWSWETNGDIQRKGVLFSIDYSGIDINTSWGENALAAVSASSGVANTAVGYSSLNTVSTGSYNTAIGRNSGYTTNGTSNAYVGASSGMYSTGNNVVFIGGRSGTNGAGTEGITSGDGVTAVGALAGLKHTNGGISNSSYFGFSTVAEQSNEVVIGGLTNSKFYFGVGRFGSDRVAITMQPTSAVSGSNYYSNETDANGVNWTFGVSQATGTGTSGDMIWQYAPSGSSGTTLTTLTEGMRFSGSTGQLQFSTIGALFNPYGTSSGNTGEIRFAELAANGSNYTGFKSPDSRSANLIYVLPTTDPTSGDVLVAGVPGGGVVGLTWATIGGTGTVTSIATTSPITGGTITTTGTIGIDNAAADGTTKGAASFTAADFNSSTGLISIDYTNGQAATSGQKGFLTSADWSTFNGKQAAGSYLTADGAVTGAGSQAQVFTSGIETGLIDDNGAGEILVLLGGIDKLGVYTSGVQTVAGSAASPSYSFFTDPTSGLYLKTAESEIGASVDGALVGGFNTAGLFANAISEMSAANGVTIDGVNLKDGLVVGQYGGTGVNNSGKTITLGGNLTTSGAHATTLTTTGTTGVTLPTTGTLATLAGTETFTNKSIVGTQLTGTSYTFAANNTGSTAAYTLQPYEDHNIADYSGTVTFNSTPPSSITSQKYSWSRIGNTVTLFFSIFYGTPGTTNTSAIITLPSDCPTPAVFAAAGDAASEYMYPINGGRVEANMTGNPSAIRGGLRKNSSNNGYEVALIFGSVSAAQCQFTISYRTQ